MIALLLYNSRRIP